MPEISYPTLTVRTEYPGAAPEEVENDISRPIEEARGGERGAAQRLVGDLVARDALETLAELPGREARRTVEWTAQSGPRSLRQRARALLGRGGAPDARPTAD